MGSVCAPAVITFWAKEPPWSSSPWGFVIICIVLSVCPASATSEVLPQEPKSESGTTSSTATTAISDSNLDGQLPCDVTLHTKALVQIEEEVVAAAVDQ